MIKGWKLDPEWVRLNNEKKSSLHQQRIEKIRMEIMLQSIKYERPLPLEFKHD